MQKIELELPDEVVTSLSKVAEEQDLTVKKLLEAIAEAFAKKSDRKAANDAIIEECWKLLREMEPFRVFKMKDLFDPVVWKSMTPGHKTAIINGLTKHAVFISMAGYYGKDDVGRDEYKRSPNFPG